jgi:inner membrane protein
MPTVMSHAVVGLVLAKAFTSRPMPPAFWLLAAGLAMAPDLDVVAFRFGIPYHHPFGHRGFSHSLTLALLVGFAVGGLTANYFQVPWWLLGIFFSAVMASHGILDLFTDGGLGMALFWPFTTTRFGPWGPIRVSTIGWSFFSWRGLQALASEIVWIWLPSGVLLAGIMFYRRQSG